MKIMKNNDPCLCGSHKRFKDCCNKVNENSLWTVDVEKGKSEDNISQYVLTDSKMKFLVCDKNKRVLVWRNRDICAAYGVRTLQGAFTVHGIDDNIWLEFVQQAPAFVYVEDQN